MHLSLYKPFTALNSSDECLDKEYKVGDTVLLTCITDKILKAKIVELLHYGKHGVVVEVLDLPEYDKYNSEFKTHRLGGKQYYKRISDLR